MAQIRIDGQWYSATPSQVQPEPPPADPVSAGDNSGWVLPATAEALDAEITRLEVRPPKPISVATELGIYL
jgi:hypothetical protein